ncbi:ciliogenesis and planar polarity effector 2-like [Planococcus citri]|uniref:ciliogenesis and planar polarity effector 2-like n=1 Tax=Planococcus citri TaxID=170843 RepID=UPI0031F793E4
MISCKTQVGVTGVLVVFFSLDLSVNKPRGVSWKNVNILMTTVIKTNLWNSPEGEQIFKNFCTNSKRKSFGILEKPSISAHYEEVSYKLFFIGKPGVGKSKTVAELAGNSAPHHDSHGIHKTNIYWPTKIWDKVILFRLQCWEAGESGLKKFSHILPACLDKTDALVFIFSFEDITSLYEVSQNISKMKGNEPNQPAIIVIGTKYSSSNTGISFSEIKEFETKWQLNILKLSNSSSTQPDLSRAGPILNSICEQLWIRDQEYILKQSFDKFVLKE